MILQDRKEREKGVAKNAVEAYVYDMRGKLYSQLEKFITEEVLCLWTNFLYHDINENLLVLLDLSAGLMPWIMIFSSIGLHLGSVSLGWCLVGSAPTFMIIYSI